MKKTLIILLSMHLLLSATGCGNKSSNEIQEVKNTPIISPTAAPTVAPTPIATLQPTVAPIVHREGIYGISNKTVSSLSTITTSPVRNDKTNKWYLCRMSDNIKFEEYARSYYSSHMSSEQVHWIINFTKHTTNCLQLLGDHLNLCIYEHIDGEEHDAATLPSGIKLAEFNIYLDNGDIVQLN